MRKYGIWATVFVAGCCLNATFAAADPYSEYRLGPQDKVNIRAYDWRPGSDDTHAWEALNDEFTVSASGALSLPIISDVNVLRLTTPEIGRRIAQKLQARLGLAHEPFVAVEVSKFRPFYVMGSVQKPGEYEYRPGLTVLQASAVAGGLPRLDDMGVIMLEKDAISSRGDLRNLEAERLQLLMRQARVKATIEEKSEIQIPSEVANEKVDATIARRLIAEETLLFHSKRKSLEAQLKILEQTKIYLQQEVASLQKKQVSQARQIELIEKEHQSVADLIGRGLTPAYRQVAVAQNLVQFQSMQLDALLAEIKARQGLAQADRDIIELRNKSRSEALTEANETRLRLVAIDERKKTAAAMLDEAELRGPQLANSMVDEQTVTAYVLTREKDGTPKNTRVSETDLVEPGDTIRVERRRAVSISQRD